MFFPELHASLEEQRPHALNVQRAFAFYLNRTIPISKSPRLFVAITERIRTSALHPKISKWISGCFLLLSTIKPPTRYHHGVRAHSVRAQAGTMALLQEVSLFDICKSTTFGSIHMFEMLCPSPGLLCWYLLLNNCPAFSHTVYFLAPFFCLGSACQSPTLEYNRNHYSHNKR